ncbi:pleckstrin homology domain-containing family S member 1 isoform X2 [Anabas testudineus]|uniref:PH domain-containing protein n=1 Tax=Anabas testudineus TaxID=64144 RepID=A0AAQ6IVP8_ANATE|nr:pleckstrin homology domain-containing family S member 1 isoform X2 [Anabas testudineus]
MHKSQKSKGGNAVFYKPAGVATEIRSGWLVKSPPSKKMKTEKSWKMRYFVLFKLSDHDHQLRYFRSATDKDRPLGGIDLSHISVLYVSPEQHPKWALIPKNLKYSPSCVLYIRTSERDYFLVGEDSDEVDAWFNDMFDALKNRPHTLHSGEELSDGQPTNEPLRKIRSISDPCSNALESISEEKIHDIYKRRASEPVQPIYDYPKSFFTQIKVTQENGSINGNNTESIYETMGQVKATQQKAQAADTEHEDFSGGTLMRSVTQVYEKMKTQISPLPPFDEESDTENREETHPSDFSSSSSENDATSPVEMLESPSVRTPESIQSSTDSLDSLAPEKRGIKVKKEDVKNHLTLTEVDGKLSVTGWTGQPKTVCELQKGDQILGVNNLQVSTAEEFNMYVSKSLKNEVKVTILRLPGHETLHSPTSFSSDSEN